jgi:hypothetical protein
MRFRPNSEMDRINGENGLRALARVYSQNFIPANTESLELISSFVICHLPFVIRLRAADDEWRMTNGE